MRDEDRAVEKDGGEYMRRLFRKIMFRLKLMDMDYQWRMLNGSCFSLFPPSFYFLHTQEEIERITREEIAELKRILQEYQERNMMMGEV